MSTIILNCFCDSIFEKLCEKLGTCSPEVVEKGTNCADVAMTAVICKTVVFVALIFVLGFLIWKLMDHIANKNSETRKRLWEVEDIERKQNSDLLTKLLDFQKDLALPVDKNKEGKYTEERPYDSIHKENYRKMIAKLLNKNLADLEANDTGEPETPNS